MAIQNTLKKVLHRKAWEFLTPAPTNFNTGGFVDTIKDTTHPFYNYMFFVTSASGIFIFDASEDAWAQLPNSGIAGTFGSGSCGDALENGSMGGLIVQTATAGSTKTLTTNRTIVRSIAGARVRVVAGTGAGYNGVIESNTIGSNSVITVTPESAVAFDSTSMFEVMSGSLLFFNAGSTATGFALYDIATNTWTQKTTTGLPAAWGTDGQLVTTTGSMGLIDSGTATSASNISLSTNKTLLLNQYANMAVRIVSGTGAGQTRIILSNTAGANSVLTTSTAPTALSAMTRAATGIVTATVAANSPNMQPGRGFTVTGASDATFNAVYTILTLVGTTLTMRGSNTTVQATAQTGTGQDTWIMVPDSTSVFDIVGDHTTSHLLGNNVTTMYKYNIGGNFWTTVTPTTSRGGSHAGGGTADIVNSVSTWNSTTNSVIHHNSGPIYKQNHRYIYSLRGGGSNTLDVFDIAANTWINGIVYGNQTETFNSGSNSFEDDDYIYIQREASGRIFKFDIVKNVLVPFTTLVYPQSTTVSGDKMVVNKFVDGGDEVRFLYTMQHSRPEIFRTLII